MKKFLLLTFAFMFALSIGSCSTDETSTKTTDASVQRGGVQPPKVEFVGQTATEPGHLVITNDDGQNVTYKWTLCNSSGSDLEGTEVWTDGNGHTFTHSYSMFTNYTSSPTTTTWITYISVMNHPTPMSHQSSWGGTCK